VSALTTAANALLPDVRRHLRFPNPMQPNSEDAGLLCFLEAIMELAELHCDSLFARTYVEHLDGGSTCVFTRNRPILSVKSVTENVGILSYVLDFVEVGTAPLVTQSGSDGGMVASSIWAYSIDNADVGQISRRTIGNALVPFASGEANIEVIYVAGESELPAAVWLGILEGMAHYWQNSQQRGVPMSATNIMFDATNGEAYSREPDSQPLDYALPFRIVQMFRTHGRLPIFA
jgi:hypothetical protein